MSYLPQWKARLRAIVILGEAAVIKKRGGRYLVGLPAPGHRLRIYGEGDDWTEALAAAEKTAKLLSNLPL